MTAKRQTRLARTGIVLAMAVSVPLALTTQLKDLGPPVRISVEGRSYFVPENTTFQRVVLGLGLRPTPGSLKDVQGTILQPGLYPGSVLLNGHPEYGDPVLADGATIAVRNGRDRREPVLRKVINVPEGEQGNPQFFLGTAPGQEVLTVGRFSGKILSSRFRPTGPATLPMAVALTFDDGPGPLTTRVLAILQRFHVQATFFVIGFLAEDHPEMIRAEETAGMVVGNHSWDHPNNIPFRNLPADRMLEEVAKTSQLLNSLGVSSYLFRPPGGSYSDQVISDARQYDSRVVLWNVDPKDWERGRTAAQIVANVMGNVVPGSIIELHDGTVNSPQTLKALPAIIRGIRRRGLSFVTLQP